MDNGTESYPLRETIAAALAELGKPELPCRRITFLLHDGYGVGRRFLFDGIHAVWLLADNIIRFYDEDGQMLKSMGVGTAERAKAA